MDDLVKQQSILVAKLNEHDAAQREKIERLEGLLRRSLVFAEDFHVDINIELSRED